MPGRILVVVPSLGPGGAERVAVRLADGWVGLGHRVRIVALDQQPNSAFSPGAGVEVFEARLGGDASNIWHGLAANWRRVITIDREVRAWAPSVIVGMTTQVAVLSVLAGQRRHVPVVVSERSYPPHHPLKLPWRVLRHVAYRRARAVVMQTGRAATWARQRFPESKVRVIPNPILVTPDGHAPPVRIERVTWAGRFDSLKNPELALRAFATAAAAFPDWTMVMCGDGPLRARCETLAAELGVAARVEFRGVADLTALLESSAIFLLTSRSEGFPNVVLEAMAAACAVLATDCPAGPAELLAGEAGVLVPVDDAATLADALRSLIQQPALRQQFGASARAAASRYSLDAILERWSALVEAT